MLCRLSASLLLWTVSLTAWAGSGAEVLSTVDKNANASSTLVAKVTATTTVAGKGDKELAFDLYVEGGKRRVEFRAPGDIKGTRVLVLSRKQMYVWLPAYNKIRRVASHVSDQGFMGTAFSDADMSTAVFAEVYDAELVGETDAVWSLKLSQLPEEKSPYAAIEMSVRKDLGLPSEIKYFNAKGQHVKTETRDNYVCEDGTCIPGTITMVDHARGGLSTTLAQEIQSINEALAPEVFSQRSLQRGL